MGILIIAWILGCIVNVGLWTLAIWDKPEFTVADLLLGIIFLVFSWLGWIVLAFWDDLDCLDSIIIYRKK